jgi:hypothetical protein
MLDGMCTNHCCTSQVNEFGGLKQLAEMMDKMGGAKKAFPLHCPHTRAHARSRPCARINGHGHMLAPRHTHAHARSPRTNTHARARMRAHTHPIMSSHHITSHHIPSHHNITHVLAYARTRTHARTHARTPRLSIESHTVSYGSDWCAQLMKVLRDTGQGHLIEQMGGEVAPTPLFSKCSNTRPHAHSRAHMHTRTHTGRMQKKMQRTLETLHKFDDGEGLPSMPQARLRVCAL